ncbi:ATP-binding cassette domain-containing protein, partial [uncultured Mobiluncus sp.]|uniref:ATP-binding cassette domain-containing protein n=1 Tax=uncultured Mobiluncus sp. TaxID=293425 RepID=UPI002804F7A1
ATGRLGKIVVDLVDVDFSYGAQGDSPPVLRDVTWRVAPGERAGILGANGAGKSTLLGLLAGDLTPTRGRRREGKTVQIGILDQEFRALREIADYRVYQVLGKLKGSFEVEGKELSPAQMLERLGFNSSQLQAKVGALSGGQKRRLQILLLLLEEPNVMILDEPTNDIDTDTLTALEDVLDAWPGTLLVVSHDRYLIERITDNQYAVIDHGLRHLPGGVDEYLELAEQARQASRPKSDEPSTPRKPLENGKTSSKADYETQKRLQSVERKLDKASAQAAQIESQLAETDPADYEKLAELAKELQTARGRVEQLEAQWMDEAEEL